MSILRETSVWAWDTEHVLAIWKGKEDGIPQIVAQLNHVFVMCRAKPAISTAEGKEILMVAIGATNLGEALVKITALQIFPDYKGIYREEEAIFRREEFVVTILEFMNVIIE